MPNISNEEASPHIDLDALIDLKLVRGGSSSIRKKKRLLMTAPGEENKLELRQMEAKSST